MCPALGKPERFAADESGATMTEYAFLLLFVVLVVFGVVRLLGQNVLPLFQIGQYFQ
jgi:Flp pilus assembly pilin Flp